MEFLKPVQCDVTKKKKKKLVRVKDYVRGPPHGSRINKKERYAQTSALLREAKHLDYNCFISNFNFTGVSPEIRKLIMSAPP